jgi:hypothetical protein
MKTIAGGLIVLAGICAVAQADDVEKFTGKVKVDRNRMQSIRKVVIVEIDGVAKVGQDDQAKPWTEMAANALFEQMKKRGWEVVMGQPVIDAFKQIVPSADPERLRRELIEKGGKSPEDAARIAEHWGEFLDFREALANLAPITSKQYTMPGSILLKLPDIDPQVDPKHPKIPAPSESAIESRLAKLAAALDADATVTVEFGFGAFQYHNATVQQAQKSGGRQTAGLFPALDEMRALKKGEQATAHVRLNIVDRDGKSKICEAEGSVMSKEGTGFTFTGNKKVSDNLMPVVAVGMPRQLFDRLDK